MIGDGEGDDDGEGDGDGWWRWVKAMADGWCRMSDVWWRMAMDDRKNGDCDLNSEIFWSRARLGVVVTGATDRTNHQVPVGGAT